MWIAGDERVEDRHHRRLLPVTLFSGLPDHELEHVGEHTRRTTVPAGTLLISALLPGEAVSSLPAGSPSRSSTSPSATAIPFRARASSSRCR